MSDTKPWLNRPPQRTVSFPVVVGLGMPGVLRALSLAASLFLAAHSVSHAGGKSRTALPRCYVADNEPKTIRADSVSFDTMRDSYPVFDHWSDDLPTKLAWGPPPADSTVTFERLGRFHEREIYRFTYKSNMTGQESFDFVLLALGLANQPDPLLKLRPFFLRPCSFMSVGLMEACAVSYSDCPFGIEVKQVLHGRGLSTTKWLFRLTNSGARLMRRTDSDRDEKTRIERYK
jgi:hypothetical protein